MTEKVICDGFDPCVLDAHLLVIFLSLFYFRRKVDKIFLPIRRERQFVRLFLKSEPVVSESLESNSPLR